MDAVFTLDSGRKIILQVQFLLNDDDRKRIQEMRNSAMKRKQQELLGDGNELNFPDIPLSKRLIEKFSNVQSKRAERPKLRKSVSLDDLQDRAAFSGINMDPRMKVSRDLPLQRGVRNTSRLEDPSDSMKANGIPESKSISSVKKMISTFEGSTSQGFISETGVSPTPTDSASTQTGKSVIPFDDRKVPNYRSGKTLLSQHIKSSAHGQTGMPNTSETRRVRRSGSRDGASKQNLRENELIRTKRRPQTKHQRSIVTSNSLEQMHSRDYVERPLNYLVATSSNLIHPHICITSASRQLKDLIELEHLNWLAHIRHTGKSQHVVQEGTQKNKSNELIIAAQTRSGGFPMRNRWLINQGVRAAIVVIACGAIFFNNR